MQGWDGGGHGGGFGPHTDAVAGPHPSRDGERFGDFGGDISRDGDIYCKAGINI